MGKTKIYNKLVRDFIPEIIKASGNSCTTHIAQDEEYKKELQKKLREEVKEFLDEPCEEEIADVLEVLEGLIELYGFDMDRIRNIKTKKKEERGGFEERIMLEEVIEK